MMQLKHNETAIVLVEFQKQWTEKGLFNQLIKRQLASRHVVENTRQLVTRARGRGLTIIHAPLVVDPHHKKGWLAYATFGRMFTKGSWKSELVPGLFTKGDLIVPRNHYNYQAFDAFYNSSLEQTLREHSIRTLFICGFATDQCPAKTLNTALRKGFNPYLVADCTATFNNFFQKSTEQKYSDRTITAQKLLKTIQE